ncbi:hypothetical protein [Leptothoe kymatousa]|uniref:Uncharacterized protein n=1 Tax=Leptothoe kymatousa TAU-MAC 1615 TaxID=2364775 RepID=A0ABS5Y4J4_9CYAN|nr:hypothetical protein [Leptothoe kymatousa]MBT9312541.1 hypothetical protein [Leptothoe kymatousa TAU-MAC 1615]
MTVPKALTKPNPRNRVRRCCECGEGKEQGKPDWVRGTGSSAAGGCGGYAGEGEAGWLAVITWPWTAAERVRHGVYGRQGVSLGCR